ncbi:MAG: hypothetical protein M3015_15680 [Bacteroidota bacterium]|nr:hypothetical protein [Bacteroidota bacterium]
MLNAHALFNWLRLISKSIEISWIQAFNAGHYFMGAYIYTSIVCGNLSGTLINKLITTGYGASPLMISRWLITRLPLKYENNKI